MGRIRVGVARVPDRESPSRAIELVIEAGFDALELDLAGGFWMKKDFARAIGEAAREHDVALSVHAPIAAFLGHLERGGGKHKRATGMLDHASGLAMLAGAELLVIHPGFLLERAREEALASVIEQLAELRERLVAKDRTVAFGVEVMGRVRDLGSEEDIVAIARALSWTRPVIDFAHLHAVTDGGFRTAEHFAAVLALVDGVVDGEVPFHIHFSDIAYANRNETKHLPYGEGTLRVEPLAEALLRFDRDATVISESPDPESHAQIREGLRAVVGSAAPLDSRQHARRSQET